MPTLETPADMAAIQATRAAETAAAVAACGDDALAAYWAQSASASVARDVAAGRVVTIQVGTPAAARARRARNAAALRAMVPAAR